MQLERLPFRQCARANRRKHRRLIRCARNDAEGTRVLRDTAVAIIAVVSHRNGNVVCTDVTCRRRPCQRGGAVHHSRRQRYTGRQCRGAKRERILINIAGFEGHAERLAHDSDDIAHPIQMRRFA